MAPTAGRAQGTNELFRRFFSITYCRTVICYTACRMAGKVSIDALKAELARLEREEDEYCRRTGEPAVDPEELEDDDVLIEEARSKSVCVLCDVLCAMYRAP